MTDPSLNDIQTELHALRARLAELETKLGNAQPAAASGHKRRFSKRWDFRGAPLAGLLFFTGGALYAGDAGEALFINPQGNVGIMTTSPKNALDVNGGLAIGAHYAGNELAPTGGAVIEGKVGIGAATPVAKLEVNLVNPQNWNGNLPGIRLISPDGNYLMDVNTYVVASGNVGYQFSPTKLGTPNTGLNITTPGYVGIGTKSPKNALDVNGGLAIGANYAGSKVAPENGAVIQGAAHVGSLAITDAQGNPYKDNWIGMANNVNSDKTPWLHIGGITDDRKKDATVSGSVDGDGKRRIALYAHKTLVSDDLDVKGAINGEKPPMKFEVGDINAPDNKWQAVNKDIGPLCGDEDGCTMKLYLRETNTDRVRTYLEQIYIEQPNKSKNKNKGLLGHTRQLGGGAREFTLQSTNQNNIIADVDWGWFYVHNFSHENVGAKSPAFPGYNVQFLARNGIVATVIIYDR